MKKIRINKNKNRIKCVSCPVLTDYAYPSRNSKTEALLCSKSSLEILLTEVKNSQISILSNSGKSGKKYNNIKTILTELNKNLNFMLKEKKSKFKNIKEENSKAKSSLQSQMFNEYDNKEQIGNKNKQNLNNEISLLQGLNLYTDCYLEQIDNIIFKKTNEINFLNMCMKYTSQEEEKETYCNEQKHFALVTKLLHKKITNIRNNFKLIVSAKQAQNEELENITSSLTQLKNYIEKRKNGYIVNNSIIEEDSKEYTQSIIFNKLNNNFGNLFNINNNKTQKEIFKGRRMNHHFSDKNNTITIDNIDDKDKDSAFSSNESDSSEKKRDIKINNNIQNLINLNMNINLNVHFDKFYGQENIIYNTERNNYDIINILNKNKRKKGLSSTGSLPHFLINKINNEIKDNPIDICNTEVFDINNINI